MEGMALASRIPRMTSASVSASTVCDVNKGTMSRSCEGSSNSSSGSGSCAMPQGYRRMEKRDVFMPADNDRAGFESTHDDGSNRLAWFLTGTIIGATVAMLYAPKSGRETRQFITDKTQKGREAVSETSKDLADASREMFERGR